jgi:uncharacterized protein
MTKIIIDTNVYFSGFAFQGKPLEVINTTAKNKNITAYCSFKIWDEIVAKFLRGRLSEIQGELYDINKVRSFLDNIQTDLQFTIPESKVTICRDPKDNMILDLAKEINADYIITGDKDLLTMEAF